MRYQIDGIEYRLEHCYPYIRIIRTTDDEIRVVRRCPATQAVVPSLFESPQDPEEIAGLEDLMKLRPGRRGLEIL